uniref:Uncharacterized protein n=1 Tax=Anguilla anguilla TaxID=7936 RepID=A0A0E9U064_ANGAN
MVKNNVVFSSRCALNFFSLFKRGGWRGPG